MKPHFLLKAITTPTELAKILGKDISVACRIINGQKRPTGEQAYLMAQHFPEHMTYEMWYTHLPKKRR